MSKQPILPGPEEIESVVLGPDSIVWQRLSDARVFTGAGAALTLQVAHPTVGSGVRDHSNFLEEPWDRLFRTVDYLNLLVYGGTDVAAAMGRRLRELHKQIKGSNPDGSRYHALEPEAYAWVHATLIESGLKAYELFVGPLKPYERERMYADFMPLGRLVGVREGDLPESFADFRDYVDMMIDERLERTETVDTVFMAMRAPADPPEMPPSLRRLWPLLRMPPSRVLRICTSGLLGDRARAKLGIPWSRPNEVELRSLAFASRRLGPLLPRDLKCTGPAYLRWRRRQIERGPLGDRGAYAEAGRPGAAAAA